MPTGSSEKTVTGPVLEVGAPSQGAPEANLEQSQPDRWFHYLIAGAIFGLLTFGVLSAAHCEGVERDGSTERINGADHAPPQVGGVLPGVTVVAQQADQPSSGPRPVEPSLFAPLVIFGAASAADLLSTEYALSRGGVESNPFLRDRPVRLAVNLGVVTASVWGVRKLQRDGHPRAARLVKWGFVGLRVVAVAVNVRRGK